ncbi:MAG TPA: CheR family methyltransferase [Chthoniobacteraceae bacterium]|jgi:chemotaxis protein methyltransferase WspC|nr:CheR family methyltransferase [Chthoniobacteraceae bacterium]
MEQILAHLRNSIGLDAASIGVSAVERAVRQRIAATSCAGTEPYARLLDGSPGEQTALIDALVVPETWFFRDPGAFSAVAAQAKLQCGPAQLRYLCIPCATGEEPYSLAMTLLESGIAPERFHIDAFDICERLLHRARRGVYGRNSFRGNDRTCRTRYFQETPDGAALHAEVRKQVAFHQANLLEDAALPATQYDAIFCRNLLIYFGEAAQQRALQKLGAMLRKGGLICAAPAETGLLLRHGFAPADIPQAFAFRHGSERKPAPARPAHFIRQLGFPPLPRPLPAPVKFTPAPPAPAPVEESLPAFSDARRLADEGRFEEVSRICHAHIHANGGTADAFYLLALVNDASSRHEEAATFYRKALYLEPRHLDALAHFSLLADRMGQSTVASALRGRAQRSEAQ